jgi:uncharacterized alpha/beta hydrolase family protein
MDLDEKIAILSHGFNKSLNDMLFLSTGLKKHGINNIVVNLPTTFCSVDDCIKSLNLQIYDIVKKYKIVNFVGHSIGGLIIRAYINKLKPENVGKCIFIATPHQGSKLAKISGYIPFYKNIFKPIKDLQPSENNNYLLENKNIAVGLIIGNNNNTILGKYFLSEESDGRVEIFSALSKDAKDIIILPYGHKEIHHKEITLKLVIDFLLNGVFRNNNNGHFA